MGTLSLAPQVLGLAWCGMQDQGAEAFGAMLKTNNVRQRRDVVDGRPAC
jgi:hypothetical protein